MKIQLCGDSMLLVELEPAIDPVINERAILLASRLRDRRARRRDASRMARSLITGSIAGSSSTSSIESPHG